MVAIIAEFLLGNDLNGLVLLAFSYICLNIYFDEFCLFNKSINSAVYKVFMVDGLNLKC